MDDKPFDRFETLEQALAEETLRLNQVLRAQRLLSAGDSAQPQGRRAAGPIVAPPGVEFCPLDLYDLQLKLEEGCASGFGGPTLASSLAMRAFRLRYLQAVAELLPTCPETRFQTFTVLNTRWVCTPIELEELKAKTLRNRFRKHLNDAGVLQVPGLFLAVIHGEFEPSSGLYTLHFHGFGTWEKVQLLKRLSGLAPGYERTATGGSYLRASALMTPAEPDWDPVEGPRELAKQASYLVKSWWPQKTIRKCDDGTMRRDRTPDRIDDSHHVQHLLWLHRQHMKHLVLMNDIWSPRKGGSEAGRGLYLLFQRPFDCPPSNS